MHNKHLATLIQARSEDAEQGGSDWSPPVPQEDTQVDGLWSRSSANAKEGGVRHHSHPGCCRLPAQASTSRPGVGRPGVLDGAIVVDGASSLPLFSARFTFCAC
jgi:hypothetical protein